MKKLFFALFVSVAFAGSAGAQTGIQFTNGFSTLNFPYKTDPQNYSLSTLIDGEIIAGTPYLDFEWRRGTILLKDGKIFDSYLIKFDTYHQVVMFLSGKDSLEVSDPIKEFILEDRKGEVHHFINAEEYKKQKKALFYEVLTEEKRGQLLKTTHAVASTSDEITNAKENKRLKFAYDYFYYDKASGKVTPLKFSAGSVRSALNLTQQQENDLFFSGYRFNDEEDLLKFFRVYLKS